MNLSPLLLFLTSFSFIVIPKQIYYYEIFKKIQLSFLKILIIQETRNLLSPNFILVREKNISTINFISFLSLFSGKYKTLMYYFDLFPNFKSWFFAKYSSMNLCPLLLKLCPLLLELFLYGLIVISLQLNKFILKKTQHS